VATRLATGTGFLREHGIARLGKKLLANPHLPWNPPIYEAHLVTPGIQLYGATIVGLRVLAIGFNDRLGWTHTVNTMDPVDRYEIRLAAGGYLFDGVVRAFDERSARIAGDRLISNSRRRRQKISEFGSRLPRILR